MSYQEVLNKKKERLAKFTGRKLLLKQRAYEKALARFGGSKTQKSAPKVPVVVETGNPEWSVYLPGEMGGVIKVYAANEKAARLAARIALGLRALPAGTKVEKR
jgi:hypothetical protein